MGLRTYILKGTSVAEPMRMRATKRGQGRFFFISLSLSVSFLRGCNLRDAFAGGDRCLKATVMIRQWGGGGGSQSSCMWRKSIGQRNDPRLKSRCRCTKMRMQYMFDLIFSRKHQGIAFMFLFFSTAFLQNVLEIFDTSDRPEKVPPPPSAKQALSK